MPGWLTGSDLDIKLVQKCQVSDNWRRLDKGKCEPLQQPPSVGPGMRVPNSERPPGAVQMFSFGEVCFHCICVPGSQLLSNWTKLSQNAGSALPATAGAGPCPQGGCLPGRVATGRSPGVSVPTPGQPTRMLQSCTGIWPLVHSKRCAVQQQGTHGLLGLSGQMLFPP